MIKNQYFASIFSLIFFTILVSIEASSPEIILPSQKELNKCKMDFNECQDFSNYPHKLVRELITNGTIEKEWFSKNKEKVIIPGCGRNPNNTIEETYYNFCQEKHIVTYPKGGFTKTGKFVYIVQMNLANESFTQSTLSTVCDFSKGCECRLEKENHLLKTELVSNLENEYDYRCFQKHGYNNNDLFIGIDENRKIIRDVTIETPQCCLCGYKRISKQLRKN